MQVTLFVKIFCLKKKHVYYAFILVYIRRHSCETVVGLVGSKIVKQLLA